MLAAFLQFLAASIILFEFFRSWFLVGCPQTQFLLGMHDEINGYEHIAVTYLLMFHTLDKQA